MCILMLDLLNSIKSWSSSKEIETGSYLKNINALPILIVKILNIKKKISCSTYAILMAILDKKRTECQIFYVCEFVVYN